MPPLLEHLESLLSGTGEALDLQTFKLVDQLSGRTLGLRADTTPQVARIDAHLLNRQRRGAPVLLRPGAAHPARPARTRRASRCSSAPRSTATPASRPTSRSCDLALDCLQRRRRRATLTLDLADARIVRALLAGVPVDARRGSTRCTPRWPPRTRASWRALDHGLSRRGARAACWRCCRLYGDADGARRGARRRCRHAPAIATALADLAAAGRRTLRGAPDVRSASTWPTCAATPTTAACASRIYARRRERRAGARRPLRRGRRGVRPQPAGGRLQPRREANWSACCRRGRCAPPIRAPWGDAAGAARSHRRTARAGRDRGLRAAGPRAAKSTNSTATASSSSTAASWARASHLNLRRAEHA